MTRLRCLAAALAARPWLAALVVAVLTAALDASARPGGGQSYGGPSGGSSGSSSGRSSGSGSGSSSGGGGGGGDLLGFFLLLIIDQPVIGIPLLVIVVCAIFAAKLKEGWDQTSWSSASRFRREMEDASIAIEAARGPSHYAPEKTVQPGIQRRESARERFEELRQVDPDFSLVLFEDFVHALFHEVHTRRGGGHLEQFAAYLGPKARAELAFHPATEVRSIVVGSMRTVAVRGEGAWIEVWLAIEANYTELDPAGKEESYYVAEEWRLSRALAAKSRPPDKTRVFGCPNCGAPLEEVANRTCRYCKEVVDTGEFDWLVSGWTSQRREKRGPMLTGTTEEVGTDAPTIVAADARERWTALTKRDPALSWTPFVARVGLVFAEFHAAWSAQDLKRMRPFLSDTLLQTEQYWIETYKKEQLRNVTEQPAILTVHLARVVSDRWFDALTVRVFAQCVDYTLGAGGRVVGGNKHAIRRYSEYWTFIRGASRTGEPRATPECPNCGAPLDIEMSGQCTHCKAHVASGEFDWVLSRIEQDEAYGD